MKYKLKKTSSTFHKIFRENIALNAFRETGMLKGVQLKGNTQSMAYATIHVKRYAVGSI